MTLPFPASLSFTSLDIEALLEQPSELPIRGLSVLKRNRLNCLAEKYNRESIRKTVAYRDDPRCNPKPGPALKPYYLYRDREISSLVQSESLCQEWGPLPDFLREKVNRGRVKEEDSKASVSTTQIVHIQQRTEQEDVKNPKWKQEGNSDPLSSKKEEYVDNQPLATADALSPAPMHMDYDDLPPQDGMPSGLASRSPTPDRRPPSEEPSPSSSNSGRKRPSSPLPQSSGRSLRPRTAINYRELNGSTRSKPKEIAGTPTRNTAPSTLPVKIEDDISDENVRAILSSAPNEASKTDRRTKTQKKAGIPTLQPGDDIKLEAGEYYRRKYPDIAIKREETAIDLNRTLRPLPDDYITPLERHEEEVTASRLCYTYLFGGNPQETFATATKQPNPELKGMMFINRNYNPDAPMHPGSSGLWLDGEADPEKPDVADDVGRKVVFVRNGSKDWILIGLAEVKGMQCLSPDEWKALKPKACKFILPSGCKETWINGLNRKRWGGALKARIVLRKELGYEPTAEQVTARVTEETQKVTGGAKWRPLFGEVTKEEIENAFDTGKARMMVYSIHVIDYPVEIQQRIIAEGPAFDRDPTAFMGSPKKKRKTKTASVRTRARNTVKKPQVAHQHVKAALKKSRVAGRVVRKKA
ncbi:hypothetical protein VNI00_012437 [Paramarasmius palmivorus]|uniref:DUF6697 domain-containing protein n=1 Tax=Paramarasmius palmivorus TaxID=297713 RepID=A0AAW0C621_9AGAR